MPLRATALDKFKALSYTLAPATGSRPRASPSARQKPSVRCAQVAQSVEQGIENPCVGGSIPSLGTILAWLDPCPRFLGFERRSIGCTIAPDIVRSNQDDL